MGIEMLYPIFFHHKIFLNGEQLFLDDNRIEKIKQILNDFHPASNYDILYLLNLETIKKIYEDIIPKDAIFVFNYHDVHDAHLYNYFDKNRILNIYSPKYPIKQNNNFSSSYFSGFKFLEKTDKFSIYEYPLKKCMDYTYSIIIFGSKDNNTKFINGFLNFLFDINENDPYRIKLESPIKNNNEDNFIDIMFIDSKKGSFKFNCINISEDIKQKNIERLLEFIKNEKFINILIFNMNKSEFNSNIEKIYEIYFKAEDQEITDIFFACPDNIHFSLKLGYLNYKMDFMNKYQQIFENKFTEELVKDTILGVANLDKSLRQEFPSYSCFFDYNCIYNSKKNKGLYFLYSISMKGYSLFLDIVKEKNNFIDTSFFIEYLNKIKNKLELVNDKIKNLEEEYKKESKLKEEKESNKKILLEIIEKQENKVKSVENKINEKNNKINSLNNDIENLKNYQINIEANKSFLIPINSKDPNKKILDNEKTYVCHICKYNCHINCQESEDKCESIIFKFGGSKCKYCPNKCKLDSHEKVSFNYPTYEYQTIDNVIKSYNGKTKKFKSALSKIEFIINKKKDEIKNIKDSYNFNELEKQFNIEKEILEKQYLKKNNLESIILTEEDNMKNIYEKIINEKNVFNNFIFNLPSDNMKFYDIVMISLINDNIYKKTDRSSGSSLCSGGRCLII